MHIEHTGMSNREARLRLGKAYAVVTGLNLPLSPSSTNVTLSEIFKTFFCDFMRKVCVFLVCNGCYNLLQ